MFGWAPAIGLAGAAARMVTAQASREARRTRHFMSGVR